MKHLILLFSLLALILPASLSAGIVGLISHLDGDVTRQDNQAIASGSVLTINGSDSIQTGEKSHLIIAFRDGTQLILFEHSAIQLDFDSSSNLNQIRLQQGDLWLLIGQAGQLYRILLPEVAVESSDASLRVTLNADGTSGLITIAEKTATVQDSSSKKEFQARSRLSFHGGTISHLSTEAAGIKLRSNLPHYYLPKSGRIPIIIRATLTPEVAITQPVPAILLSSSPHLAIESPVIRFHQEEIEIKVTALGTGDSTLYLVSEAVGSHPGFDGAVSISVSPMQETKLMKLKTSRGTINIKLAPTDN